jgi:hypothetical protein
MTSIRRGSHRFRGHHPPEIRVRVETLPPEDITVVRGFRVTTITRTLIDLAGDLPMHEAKRITRQAIDRGLVSLEELRRAAEVRTDIRSIESFRQVMRDLYRP